jgi:hypothetical protein
MADTIRSQADILTNLFEDGQPAGSLTPQDMRDFIVSTFGAFTLTKSASYTPTDTTDAGLTLVFTAAGAVTWSIPTNAVVPYAIGTVIQAVQYGAGQITIAAVTPGTTAVRTPSSLTSRAQYSTIGVRKHALDEWIAFGDLT